MMRVTGFLAGVGLTVAAFMLVLNTRENQQPGIVTEATEDPTPAEFTAVVEAIAEHVDEPGTASGKPRHGQAQVATDVSDRKDTGATSTYLFWSPFRSEWAAQGFAGRLTASTQVPVEVVNAGPGNYQVAFSYQNETDRLARIERIETITGLKLE